MDRKRTDNEEFARICEEEAAAGHTVVVGNEVPAKPILFSAPMIRAILDGKKTQTRRVVNTKPNKAGLSLVPELLQKTGVGHASPYGIKGGRLWVRETWLELDADMWNEPRKPKETLTRCGKYPRINAIAYRAECDTESDRIRAEYGYKWRPSIFMPRWASRITLEITGVQVQRLQEITEADAIAEGFGALDKRGEKVEGCTKMFARLWDELNAKRGYGWEVNPWVWVVSFKRL